MYEELQEIGLTPAEIKVYVALLELGPSRTGPIMEKSGLQSSVVYASIFKLIEKGFISSIKEGKTSYYQASDPRSMLRYVEEKKEQIENLIPRLLAKQSTAKERPQAVLFRGARGIKHLLNELLEAGGKTHHTIGSARESLMLGDAFWINYHKKRAAKCVWAKLIFNESLKSWHAEKKYPKAEVRYTKQGFEPLTETIIRNDKVGIIIWTEKPIGILIHNRTVAESYDKFFELVWRTARS